MTQFQTRMKKLKSQETKLLAELVALHLKAFDAYGVTMSVKKEDLNEYIPELLKQRARLSIREMMQYAGKITYQQFRTCVLKLEENAHIRRVPQKTQLLGRGNCPSWLWEIPS